MTFAKKDWKDSPNTSTPLSAAALEDLETRVTDYTDQQVAIVTVALPWNITIVPVGSVSEQTNWSTLTQSSTGLMGGNLASTGAINAKVGWDVVLAVGTWTIKIIYGTGPQRGIYTVTLDGASVGTVDGYAVSTAENVAHSFTGIDVTAQGKKRLLFQMATKNASSSSYFGNLQLVTLTRTA